MPLGGFVLGLVIIEPMKVSCLLSVPQNTQAALVSPQGLFNSLSPGMFLLRDTCCDYTTGEVNLRGNLTPDSAKYGLSRCL